MLTSTHYLQRNDLNVQQPESSWKYFSTFDCNESISPDFMPETAFGKFFTKPGYA